MSAVEEMLRPTEAAVVSGVELKAVNHAIDRDVLPSRLVRRGRARGVSAEACVYLAFYHGAASRLTAEERRFAIFAVDERVASDPPRSTWKTLASHCKVAHEYLHIDLKPFLTLTRERWDRYIAAREMVTDSPGVLGGIPVIKGTRVPVHDIAASVDAAIPLARILEAYPSITAEQVELASLYARANPLPGRPAERPFLKGATIVSRRFVERKQAGG